MLDFARSTPMQTGVLPASGACASKSKTMMTIITHAIPAGRTRAS